MSGKVGDLVSGYIEELEGKKGKKGPKPVPFSMRLGERDHERLVWLAEKLGVPKTPLAEQLLKAAVDEAVERYAGWASPDDPEGFVEEAFGGVEGPGRDRGKTSEAERPPGPGYGPHPPEPGHEPGLGPHPPKPGHGHGPPPRPGHGLGHGPPPPGPQRGA